jgi:hypothetical protein
MKNILLVLVSLLSISTFAKEDREEVSLYLNISGNNISIKKTYVGEPVSRRRRLVITQNCDESSIELYNDKFCDFDGFEAGDSSLSFQIKFYNPDTGECTSPNPENVTIKLSNKCEK